MNDNELDKLIKIEQLPKIFYQLEEIGKEVDKALVGIEDMECNEENKQEVKKRKQEITKFKNLMETRRKEIKQQILLKYDEFNKKYEDEVKIKLENAEQILTSKYTKIEQEQIEKQKEELQLFAKEHFKANNIEDIVTFEDIGLKITLSASTKSLKEQVVSFCEKVANEVKIINMEENYSDEIFLEYKQCLDFIKAKTIVHERHSKLEEIKQQQDKIKEKEEKNNKIVEEVEKKIEELEILPPKEIIEVQFKIKSTIDKIKKVKDFLEREGIDYV